MGFSVLIDIKKVGQFLEDYFLHLKFSSLDWKLCKHLFHHTVHWILPSANKLPISIPSRKQHVTNKCVLVQNVIFFPSRCFFLSRRVWQSPWMKIVMLSKRHLIARGCGLEASHNCSGSIWWYLQQYPAFRGDIFLKEVLLPATNYQATYFSWYKESDFVPSVRGGQIGCDSQAISVAWRRIQTIDLNREVNVTVTYFRINYAVNIKSI